MAERTLLQAKMEDFGSKLLQSGSNSIPITQVDTLGLFNMNTMFTYASPDPVVSPGTEQFHIQGSWNSDPSLDHVNFSCKLFGVKVYDENISCTSPDPSGSNCPQPTSPFPSNWQGDFLFDVPAGAPSGIDYDITVTAKDAADNDLFEITAVFQI